MSRLGAFSQGGGALWTPRDGNYALWLAGDYNGAPYANSGSVVDGYGQDGINALPTIPTAGQYLNGHKYMKFGGSNAIIAGVATPYYFSAGLSTAIRIATFVFLVRMNTLNTPAGTGVVNSESTLFTDTISNWGFGIDSDGVYGMGSNGTTYKTTPIPVSTGQFFMAVMAWKDTGGANGVGIMRTRLYSNGTVSAQQVDLASPGFVSTFGHYLRFGRNTAGTKWLNGDVPEIIADGTFDVVDEAKTRAYFMRKYGIATL